MSAVPPPPNDARVAAILAVLAALAAGDPTARVQPAGLGDGLDAIADGLNALVEAWSRRMARQVEAENRLDELLDVMMAIARLEFTKRASVSDEGTVFDALAIGLNMLGEELVASTISRAYLESVLASMLDPVVVVDADGAIQTANQATLDMLGYRLEELIGRRLDVIAPEQADPAAAASDTAAEMSPTVETVLRAKAGGWVPVSLCRSVLRTHDGEIQGTVYVARDITRQRQTEAALREARDAAVQAAKLKSDFLAAMSHEIRTPLHAIIGYAQVLLDGLDGGLNDEQRQDAQHIYDAGGHLLSLINDILDLSRIEAGRLEVRPEPVAVGDIVGGVVETIRPLAEAKHLALQVSVAEGLPPLWGNPARLRQVLLNLVSNALKFTERGVVTIQAWHDEGYAHLAVQDTGPGIPPEAQEVIFEEFRQLDQSSTRKHEGTGLGLAICRRLVTLMNGRIWVKSAVGAGSTFHVLLPLAPTGQGPRDGGNRPCRRARRPA